MLVQNQIAKAMRTPCRNLAHLLRTRLYCFQQEQTQLRNHLIVLAAKLAEPSHFIEAEVKAMLNHSRLSQSDIELDDPYAYDSFAGQDLESSLESSLFSSDSQYSNYDPYRY